jgi:hypothetical protein
MRSVEDVLRSEAALWRKGIRDGEIRCHCREPGYSKFPKDECGHIIPGRKMCSWDYAVLRIYEIERMLKL